VNYYYPKVSDRVKFKTTFYEGTGTIMYVDYPNLYNNWLCSIQVETDEPYDENGHRVLRLNLTDIVGVL
jgi:hypothetical protein